PSWITTLPPRTTLSGRETPSPSSSPAPRSDGRSTRALLERALQRLEHPHDAHAGLDAGARLAALADAVDEVAALDAQRLLVRHARAPHVSGPRDVLAVGLEVLVEALVVDGDLAVDLHVVERGHPARPDDREAALLVRVEPREMHMRREPRREAQVAEHHVLDPVAHVALAVRVYLGRLLAGLGDLLGLRDRLRQRLLHEAVLSGLEHALRERGVARDVRGDRHGV